MLQMRKTEAWKSGCLLQKPMILIAMLDYTEQMIVMLLSEIRVREEKHRWRR